MLTRKKRATLPYTVKLEGQGDVIEFGVVFKNISQKELEAVTNKPDMHPGEPLLAYVESWESEYPLTLEGAEELEGDRPGSLVAIMQHFYEARQMHIKGN